MTLKKCVLFQTGKYSQIIVQLLYTIYSQIYEALSIGSLQAFSQWQGRLNCTENDTELLKELFTELKVVFDERDQRVAECTLGENGNSTEGFVGCQVPEKVCMVIIQCAQIIFITNIYLF